MLQAIENQCPIIQPVETVNSPAGWCGDARGKCGVDINDPHVRRTHSTVVLAPVALPGHVGDAVSVPRKGREGGAQIQTCPALTKAKREPSFDHGFHRHFR